MQYSGTVVFVFKDLANYKDCFRISLEPALYSGLLWEVQLIYTDKAHFLTVLLAQGDQTVVLECGNEMALFGRKVAVLNRLGHQLERHRAGDSIAVMQ